MATLILVRHAKSDWGNPGLDDHDRPLNDRGLRDAPAMAARLTESGVTVGAIVSSTALRARTTAAFFGREFDLDPQLSPDLYGAPPRVLLSSAAGAGAETVMVVAHDPGMTMLAADLSDGGIAHMPTCAVATFDWPGADWAVATATPPASWTFASPR